MANWQMVNVLTGTTEKPKYNAVGVTEEIWTVALTTALANADTILGPTIPAGTYVTTVAVDVTGLDSNGSPTLSFECGWVGTLAGFIATPNTTARAGGIAAANVAGTTGRTFATDTQVVVTITAGPATAVAGTMRLRVGYVATP